MKTAHLLKTAPSHLGVIARAIDNSLKHSRPCLSLPAAMTFCATLKSGRVFYKNTHPTLYTLAIAPSAYGKSTVQQRIEDIATELNLDIIGREPGSDSGLVRSIQQTPRQFCLYDEFGLAVSEFATGKASYRALMIRMILGLFSSAGRKYRGMSYATKDPIDIQDPFFNLFGVSTGSTFFPALSNDFVHNGFLSRFFCFFAGENLPERDPKPFILPDYTLDWIKYIDAWTPEDGDLGSILKVKAYEIDLSQSQTYNFVIDKFDLKTEQTKDEFERVFWARAGELFTKLCLVVLDDELIEDVDLKGPIGWAYEVTEFCISNAIKECREKLGSSSAKGKLYEDFLNLFDGEKVSLTNLGKRAHNRRLGLSSKERADMVQELVNVGSLEEIVESEPDSQKKSKYYRKIKT